jgi:hypothetical protein
MKEKIENLSIGRYFDMDTSAVVVCNNASGEVMKCCQMATFLGFPKSQ